NREAAERELRALKRRARESGDLLLELDVMRMSGMLQLQSGDLEGAAGSLARALEIARDIPAPFTEALILGHQATMLLAEDRRDDARESLNAASARFLELDATGPAEAVAQILATLGPATVT